MTWLDFDISQTCFFLPQTPLTAVLNGIFFHLDPSLYQLVCGMLLNTSETA